MMAAAIPGAVTAQTVLGAFVTGAIVHNRVIRANGTTKVQSSGVTIDDSAAVSGCTQLNVDNLRLDGNTISSQDANGNIFLDPNGTGAVIVEESSADLRTALGTYQLSVGTNTNRANFALACANAAGAINFRGFGSGGTIASPSATPNGSGLIGMVAHGHDGTAWTGAKGALTIDAPALWTGASNPTNLLLRLTPAGSTTLTTVGKWYGSGGLYVGASPADPGANNLTVQGAVGINSSTASTSPTTGALVVTGGAGIGGQLNAATDTDTLHTLGRAAIGYDGTNADVFSIAHVDNVGNSNYAIRQGSAGGTAVNGATGQAVSLRINNSSKLIATDDAVAIDTSLRLANRTELTIASGAVTKTKSHHTIDTEADAASDDLATINGGTDGDLLIIRPANAARTVVVVQTGNISMDLTGGDFTMDDAHDILGLIYSSDDNSWHELFRKEA